MFVRPRELLEAAQSLRGRDLMLFQALAAQHDILTRLDQPRVVRTWVVLHPRRAHVVLLDLLHAHLLPQLPRESVDIHAAYA